MVKKARKVIKTFVVIARMEVGPQETFARMFLTPPRTHGELPKGMKFVQIIPLDKPMIISPKGFKSLEVIPIDSEFVLHGKGKRRTIRA